MVRPLAATSLAVLLCGCSTVWRFSVVSTTPAEADSVAAADFDVRWEPKALWKEKASRFPVFVFPQVEVAVDPTNYTSQAMLFGPPLLPVLPNPWESRGGMLERTAPPGLVVQLSLSATAGQEVAGAIDLSGCVLRASSASEPALAPDAVFVVGGDGDRQAMSGTSHEFTLSAQACVLQLHFPVDADDLASSVFLDVGGLVVDGHELKMPTLQMRTRTEWDYKAFEDPWLIWP